MLCKVTDEKVDCLVCPVFLAMVLLKDKELVRLLTNDEHKLFDFVMLLHRMFLTWVSTNI